MSEDLIRVTIKRSGSGNMEVELEVSPSQTIGETKQLLRDTDGEPVDELQLNGETVEDSTAIAKFADSKVPLVFTAKRRTLEVTATATAKRRKRCSFASCTSQPLRGAGDCSQCMGRFCSKHRLLESHACNGLQSCKDQLRERNALKLQQQQTVAHKV